MSLPAGQQRVLNAIEDGLSASEPRLASMFAIFTRLTSNEASPHREQLPSVRGARGALAWLRYALPVRRALRSGWLRGRRPLARVMIMSQLVAVLAVLGLLIGLNTHTSGGPAPASRTRLR